MCIDKFWKFSSNIIWKQDIAAIFFYLYTHKAIIIEKDREKKDIRWWFKSVHHEDGELIEYLWVEW